jgi:hypothetical protein
MNELPNAVARRVTCVVFACPTPGDIMRWMYMIMSGVAAYLFFGHGPMLAFYGSVLVLAVSFATFCLLYDEPIRRAAHRVNIRLGQITSKGIHADEYQRLQSSAAVATADDKRFRWTPMSITNVAAGLAGAMLLLWAVMIRFV